MSSERAPKVGRQHLLRKLFGHSRRTIQRYDLGARPITQARAESQVAGGDLPRSGTRRSLEAAEWRDLRKQHPDGIEQASGRSAHHLCSPNERLPDREGAARPSSTVYILQVCQQARFEQIPVLLYVPVRLPNPKRPELQPENERLC
jgi:hypothetical protein